MLAWVYALLAPAAVADWSSGGMSNDFMSFVRLHGRLHRLLGIEPNVCDVSDEISHVLVALLILFALL